jgi:hypothetical protein
MPAAALAFPSVMELFPTPFFFAFGTGAMVWCRNAELHGGFPACVVHGDSSRENP